MTRTPKHRLRLEALAANGFSPNPKGGQQGYLRKAA